MAKLIKKAIKKSTVKVPELSSIIVFPIQVPLQNIGTTFEYITGTVVKINRKTVDAEDKHGNIWRVALEELRLKVKNERI
jgi:hypothetical protein